MKKSIAVIAMMLCLVSTMVAETLLSVGGGYSINTQYFDFDGENSTTNYQSPSICIDAKTSLGANSLFGFGSFQAFFPSSAKSKNEEGTFTESLKFSYNLTTELGLGYMFLNKTNYPIFVGGGISLTNSEINSENSDNETFKTTDIFVGALATIQAHYFFKPNFGVLIGTDFNYSFLPLVCKMEMSYHDKSYDMKDNFKSSTNFNIRAGLTYKF